MSVDRETTEVGLDNPEPTELRSGRGLVLRPFGPDDAETLFALIDANRGHLSQLDDTTAEKYPDVQSVLDSITNPANPERRRYGIWTSPSSPREVMLGTINQTSQPDNRAEVGYWIGRQYCGLGYATAAIECLAEAAKAQGYAEVFATTHPHNVASMLALRKAGFELAGAEADQARFVFEADYRDDLVLDVEPIGFGSQEIYSDLELAWYVERPLIPACKVFRGKGIRTVMSSANRVSIGNGGFLDLRDGEQLRVETGRAWIMVDYDSLSPENQALAAERWDVHRLKEAPIGVDRFALIVGEVRYDSTITEVADHFSAIANEFAGQRPGQEFAPAAR